MNAVATKPDTKGTKAAKADKPEPTPIDLGAFGTYEFQGVKVLDLRGKGKPTKLNGKEHKYAKAHAAAEAAGSPVRLGWKHSGAVFIPNPKTNQPIKATGMTSMIMSQVAQFPKGIEAIALVPRIRALSKNNTRSDFASGQETPIGHAEGWIDNAVNKGYILVSKERSVDFAKAEAAADAAVAGKGADSKSKAA